jgi:membrane-associated phospholipid phosphatase
MIYLISYLFYFGVNSLANNVIKNIIQAPRPTEQIFLNNYDKCTHDIISDYGMPSGHAQSVGYSITFLYLVVYSPPVFYISIFISAITMYQRYTYNRHTIIQLIVGLIIGSIVGMVSYTITHILVTNKKYDYNINVAE